MASQFSRFFFNPGCSFGPGLETKGLEVFGKGDDVFKRHALKLRRSSMPWTSG